jgi:hypothetical protein
MSGAPQRFRAVIARGKPVVQARVRFGNYLRQHFGEGEEVDVMVTPHHKNSTNEQRGFYRAVVVPIFADWMGEADEDAAHQALAWKFLRLADHPVTGTPRRQSTSRQDMSASEFSAYLERCIAWGTVECGLLFPPAEKNPAKRDPLRRAS